MANNFRVHTDANYRIREDIGPLMQSSRYFNKNNCMVGRSLRRNIISDSFVQPYTQNFDDGACDYNIARESDLKIGNHGYYSRPQNYEEQLNLSQDNMRTVNSNSKLDQSYNIAGTDLPSLNSTQRQTYYPYAFGGDLTGNMGQGVMGNFAPHDSPLSTDAAPRPSGYYEPYAYRKAGSNDDMNKVLREGESNFGNFNPKYTVTSNPTHADYNAGRLEYLKVNPAARSYANTSPKSIKYQEQFQSRPQSQPREGFFFESVNYPGNNMAPDYEEIGEIMGRTTESLANTIQTWRTLASNLKEKLTEVRTKLNEKLGLTVEAAPLTDAGDAARNTSAAAYTVDLSNTQSNRQTVSAFQKAVVAYTQRIENIETKVIPSLESITADTDVTQIEGADFSEEDRAILDSNKLLKGLYSS